MEQENIQSGNPARRYRRYMGGLAVLMVTVFVASTCMGRFPVSPLELMQIIGASIGEQVSIVVAWVAGLLSSWGLDIPISRIMYFDDLLPSTVDQFAATVVLSVRLPRVFAALLVGAALSVAGAAYQGMFQNPMVSQDILGASSGAAFGAALGILLAFGAFEISLLAFVFGLAAVVASLVISKASKTSPLVAMILAGMIVSALFSAGTSFIKLVADTEEALPAITYWLMGSLASIRPNDIAFVIVPLLVGLIPIFALRWRINLLATGEEEAKSMGVNTFVLRGIVIACATLLTAACVSISGLIGWVGLVIPHFCRIVLGHDYRRIMPAAVLMGSSFLMVVDDLARLVAVSEIPLGILTAFVGGPVFVWLLMRMGKKHA